MTPAPRSPTIARTLLTRMLARDCAEFVLGDLEEIYARRRAARGRLRADAWYWRVALAVLLGRMSPGDATTRPGGVGVPWGGLLLDARAAARSLRRTPGFTLVASGTLALGLGVTIAVYAMADQLILRPPTGVRDAEHAVYIDFTDAAGGGGTAYLSPVDIEDLRSGADAVVEQLTAVAATRAHVSVEAADPVSAQVGFVDGPWFELLGVTARRGRLPSADELGFATPPTIAVMSERLWTTLFARDPDVVGRSVRINGHPVTIVAVAANGFAGLERGAPVDLWVPSSALVPVLEFERDRLMGRQAALYPHLIGRLRTGVDREAAGPALQRVAERIASSLPEGERHLQGYVPRVHAGIHIPPDVRAKTRESLRILAAVVALVLIVACANVANLLLFRALRGRQDVAVRRALGASRTRIVVQQMVGNGMLTLAALLAGIAFAFAITRAFAGRKLLGMPAFDSLPLDGRLLLFACGVAFFAAVMAGTVPAWIASRSEVSPARFGGARTTGRHEGLRRAMTVVQLTASLALIVAALLLMRTVRSLYAVDPGFSTAGVNVVAMDLPATFDVQARTTAFMRATAAAAGVAGVEAVALDVAGPLVSRLRGPVVRASGEAAGRTFGIVTFVTPEWFDVMQVRVVRGRGFTTEDLESAGASRVILSEGLSRTLFGEEDPIGRRIRAFGRRQEVEIIGIAEDIRYAQILNDPEPVVYHPWTEPMLMGTTVLLYRQARAASDATAAAVRAALTHVEPQLAVEMPLPLTARLDEQLADHRLFAQLLALLSALAAVLAGVGLYGVAACAVADRTREFGIRMALGAPAAGIMRLVLLQTAFTIVIGAAFGLAAAALLARGLADRLHGVSALDPLTYLLAILTLGVIAAVASVGPVKSATRVDPMSVLREE